MVSRPAKGSHRVFMHLKLAEHVSLSGAHDDDAKNYEEKKLAERSKTRGKQSDRYPLFVSWSDEDQGCSIKLSWSVARRLTMSSNPTTFAPLTAQPLRKMKASN
jgi:hypothetical protein